MTSDAEVGNTHRVFKRDRWRFLRRRIWLETEGSGSRVYLKCLLGITDGFGDLPQGRQCFRKVCLVAGVGEGHL